MPTARCVLTWGASNFNLTYGHHLLVARFEIRVTGVYEDMASPCWEQDCLLRVNGLRVPAMDNRMSKHG